MMDVKQAVVVVLVTVMVTVVVGVRAELDIAIGSRNRHEKKSVGMYKTKVLIESRISE